MLTTNEKRWTACAVFVVASMMMGVRASVAKHSSELLTPPDSRRCCARIFPAKEFVRKLDDRVFCRFAKNSVRLARKKMVCGDGSVVDGHYCGSGTCDEYGCNCNRRNCLNIRDVVYDKVLCPPIIMNKKNYMKYFRKCSETKTAMNSSTVYANDCPPSCEETLYNMLQKIVALDETFVHQYETHVGIMTYNKPLDGFNVFLKRLSSNAVLTSDDFLSVKNACASVSNSTTIIHTYGSD